MDEEIVFDRYDPRERRWHRRFRRWVLAHALWGKLLCALGIAVVAEASGLAGDPALRLFYRASILLLLVIAIGPHAWGWWLEARPRRSRFSSEDP